MADIYFYNTLHRQKERFVPVEKDKVSLYTCGPTVYDFAHIGNLRTYIFSDTLRRVLHYNGYQVTHTMNITDVGHLVGDGDEGEDKLEVGALREGKHPLEIAKKYEQAFLADFHALNCLDPTHLVRATEAIESQIALIAELEKKGFTYQDETAIYFDTSKLGDYGKLTGQKSEEKLVGAREEVVIDSRKRHPQDFVLWFFLAGRYKHHILRWNSPWGPGFPGWHVECSAIVHYTLGQPIDIHTGGVDHIGTHHTNEIAQSEAAYGKSLAHYWLHAEHLMVEGRRMGKSEGNLVRLATIEEHGYSASDFRYLVLTSHYRSKMNFTWAALEGAHKAMMSIRDLVQKSNGEDSVSPDHQEAILRAWNNDLDSPRAIALLHQAGSGALWRHWESVLGLSFSVEPKTEDIPHEVTLLVSQREEARAHKQWQKADIIREHIARLGYTVRDTDTGPEVAKER